MEARSLLSGAGMRGRATLASDTALAREAQLRWPLTQGRGGGAPGSGLVGQSAVRARREFAQRRSSVVVSW